MSERRSPSRSRAMSRGLTVAATLAILAILVLSSNGFGSATPAKGGTGKLAQLKSHISHVIFLMQENHAFDNLFGTYCVVTGPKCPSTANTIPVGTCVPRAPGFPLAGCVKTFDFTVHQLQPISDLNHDWNSTHAAYNRGAMDGFFGAESGNIEAFGHYNGTTVPVYWDLAEEYSLGDNFFSPVQSFSLANHWYMFGAGAPASSYIVKTANAGSTARQGHLYLNQSNTTPSLEDELVNSSVSWKYYDYGLPPYNNSISRSPIGPAYDYWNPLAARVQSYQTGVASHFVPRSSFFGDAANGTLPSLSWIIPTPSDSDHPPRNMTYGQNWVASIVDALEGSPEWNSTVLFVSWDEYGGFYDHVAPPALDSYGDGFRVPVLAIGPWVRQGFIDHDAMDFDSVLHLMEKRFGLACLGARDCNATIPYAMFNFNRSAPRAPIGIPSWANATYPMPLQSSGQLPPFGPMRGLPVWNGGSLTDPLPTNIDWN